MKHLKKKEKKLSPWVVVIAALVLVGILLVIFIGGNKGAEETPENPDVEIGNTQLPEPDSELPEPSADISEPSSEPVDPNDPEQSPEPSEFPEPTEPTEPEDEPTETPAESEEPKPESTAPPKDQREPADTSIETPYGTLNFSEDWARFLRVETKEGKDYAVEFYAEFLSGKTQKLFTIRFGGSEQGAIGLIAANGKEVPVHVESVEFKPGSEWSDSDVNVVFSMQECLNDILAELELIPPQQEPQEEPVLPDDDGTDMAIDTPYGELYYPSRWKEYLTLKVEEKDGYSVTFSSKVSGHAEQCLFVVYFGSQKGIEVGAIKDASGRSIRVSVDIFPFEPDGSWSDSDSTIIFAMQEDMNYLLSKLG